MLEMIWVMAYGLTRSCPRSHIVRMLSWKEMMPPMPVPNITPALLASSESASICSPESAMAWAVAAKKNWS